MQNIILLYIFLNLTTTIAQEAESPEFYLGEGMSKWGVMVTPDEGAPFSLRLGTRLQTVTNFQNSEDSVTGQKVNFQDFYARRVRFQLEAKYKENMSFNMDVRNDDAGKNDKGESDFNVGDAFFEFKNIFNSSALSVRAFRAKVDVSRTQTIGSANILYLDRPKVADEAAQFVNHNRRATNIQMLGNFDNRLNFQLVAGDGVSGELFNDAKGERSGAGSIYRQNFMVGGKIKVAPFKGWEDENPNENYFGIGKHFTVGYGLFHTGDIQFESVSGVDAETSRTLTNIEASAHYSNFAIQAEYFHFQGVVEDFSSTSMNLGSSDGYYIQGEYVIPSLSYVAPFARYESWDRFHQVDDYDFVSYVAGANWYLKGNKIRVGLFYQIDDYDRNALTADDRGLVLDDNQAVKVTTMFHY